MSSNPGRIRARGLLALRLLVTLAALGLLVHLYDARLAARILGQAGLWAFVAGFGLYGACILASALKWRSLQPDVPLGTLLHAMLASCYYAILPSGQLGAELGKMLIIKAVRPEARGVLSAIVLDKVLGVASLLVLCAAGLALTQHCVPSWQLVLVSVLVAGCVIALAATAVVHRLPGGDPSRTGVVHRSWRAGLGMVAEISEAMRRPRAIVANLLLGVVLQSCVVGMYLVLAPALGIHAETANMVALVGIANLAALLPVSIGGFGVREAGLTSLLATASLATGEQALALAFASMSIILAWAAVGAVVELAMLLRAPRPAQPSS